MKRKDGTKAKLSVGQVTTVAGTGEMGHKNGRGRDASFTRLN